MKRVIKFAQTIRNNWKKSTVAACLISYGVNYTKSSYDTRQMMRKYCETAAQYGDQSQPLTKPLRRITVILNPAAKKKKCKELYEKYSAPLLHLAGVIVTVVQTEFEGQARDLPASLDPMTDAIVIAGGDGTVSETVTGLLRRAGGNVRALQNLPIAVLPLGRKNELATALCGEDDEIKALAEATMSVIDGSLKQLDVMKIDPIEEDGKPVYSLSRVEWGAHRDATAKRDKYWILGSLREYCSYLFAGAPAPAPWVIQYCEPCRGCSKCHTPEASQKRWWQAFVPKAPTAAHLLVPNENCGVMQEKSLSAIHWSVVTDTVAGEVAHPLSLNPQEEPTPRPPQLSMQVGPQEQGVMDFIDEGWARVDGTPPQSAEVVQARYVRVIPAESGDGFWYSIDNEDFEMKPIALTLLPKAISVFTPRPDMYI